MILGGYQDPQKVLGSGHGLGLGPRCKEVPLRGAGGRCYVLWMLETPRVRQGLEKEAYCKGHQRSQECHPGMPTGCTGKGTVHRTTRPEPQGREFAQGMWNN